MTELDWITEHSFESLTKREFDWLFIFDRDVQLVATCLWRLLEKEHVRFTSADDGQKFGLPAPVDVALELNQRVADARVQAATLRAGTLDLTLRFSTGHVLEVIPDSSGYEAWQMTRLAEQYIAVGGGELAIFRAPPHRG